MSVCCECCVLSGRGLCNKLIASPEESYRLWCVWVWSVYLKNEEALARVGSKRHGKGIKDYLRNFSVPVCHLQGTQLPVKNYYLRSSTICSVYIYIYIYIYILVNKANLVHNFSQYVYFFSLHVSGDYVPIIRRNNCIYTTLRICHSVWMTVWYAGCTLHTRQSVIHLQDYTRTHDQQNIFIYLRI